MKLTKFSTFAAIAVSALALKGQIAFAQDDAPAAPPAPPTAAPQGGGDEKPPQAPPSEKPGEPPQPPPDGGRQGNGRPRSFEEFQQRMNDRIKEALKATDEEWSVIQPLLQKVQTKQRETMGQRFGGMGGRRGGGGDQGNRGNRPGSAETDALRAAVEQESASTEDVKAKLAALREARKKSQAELEQTREELKKVLTIKQEATLVLFGILE